MRRQDHSITGTHPQRLITLDAADERVVLPVRTVRLTVSPNFSTNLRTCGSCETADLYKHRNVVERCFNRFEQFRDLATRYGNRAAYYQAELTIATIILWLR